MPHGILEMVLLDSKDRRAGCRSQTIVFVSQIFSNYPVWETVTRSASAHARWGERDGDEITEARPRSGHVSASENRGYD